MPLSGSVRREPSDVDAEMTRRAIPYICLVSGCTNCHRVAALNAAVGGPGDRDPSHFARQSPCEGSQIAVRHFAIDASLHGVWDERVVHAAGFRLRLRRSRIGTGGADHSRGRDNLTISALIPRRMGVGRRAGHGGRPGRGSLLHTMPLTNPVYKVGPGGHRHGFGSLGAASPSCPWPRAAAGTSALPVATESTSLRETGRRGELLPHPGYSQRAIASGAPARAM
jgi:hypothetical protein